MIKLYQNFLMNTQLHNVTQTAEVQIMLPKVANSSLRLNELMSCDVQLGMLVSPTSLTPSTR